MNPASLLTNFADRGISIVLVRDNIKLSASKGIMTSADANTLGDHKPDVLRLLRLADGLPVDDEAAVLLAMDEVDPSELPTCPTCGRLCDTQTLDDYWRCSPCDPDAGQRRRRTKTLQRTAAAIRYIHNRNG